MAFSPYQHKGTKNMQKNDPRSYNWSSIQCVLLRHHNGEKNKIYSKALTQDQVNKLLQLDSVRIEDGDDAEDEKIQSPRLFRCGFTKIRTPFHATMLTVSK